jgi:hypothetical protein
MALPSLAVEEDTSDIWQDEKPRWGRQLTEERIEQIMKRIAEANPEKAEQLEKLRKEDPEKFRAELRQTIGERFRKNGGRRGTERGGPGMRGEGERRGPGGPDKRGEGEHRFGPGGGGRGGPGGFKGELGDQMRMHQQRREFVDWLKKNYPDEAEKIEKLREDKPDMYEKRRGMAMRKYREIFEASKTNPALAEIFKKDMTLRRQRAKLTRQIKGSEDEEQKKNLTAELIDVVGQRFDLLIKRKQLEFEQLRKKLEQLKAELEKKQLDVARWQQPDFKAKSVKERIKDLISEKRKFRWD